MDLENTERVGPKKISTRTQPRSIPTTHKYPLECGGLSSNPVKTSPNYPKSAHELQTLINNNNSRAVLMVLKCSWIIVLSDKDLSVALGRLPRKKKHLSTQMFLGITVLGFAVTLVLLVDNDFISSSHFFFHCAYATLRHSNPSSTQDVCHMNLV